MSCAGRGIWARASRRIAFVLTLAALAFGCLAAQADAFVYWVNFIAGTIGRANLDGTSANQSFITGASVPLGVAVDGQHVYWANNRQRHDRAGQPRRHRRQPELHHRRQRAARGGGRRPARLLGQLQRRPRSGGRTSTARAPTRASSPAPTSPTGWRSTASTSTGPTPRGTIGRAEPRRHAAPTRASSPVPATPSGWRSTARTSTGPTPALPTRSGGRTSTARASNQSFITGANDPDGVAVDGQHVYWANAAARHDRAREPRRLGRQPELHQRRRRADGGGGGRPATAAVLPGSARRRRAGPTRSVSGWRRSFSCAEGDGGPGLPRAPIATVRARPGRWTPRPPGTYTYTVTATSRDGQTGTASITYTVGAAIGAIG